MSKVKIGIIAAVAALAAEGLCMLGFMRFGPDGPASPLAYIAFALMPAVEVGEYLGAQLGTTSLFVYTFGFLEFFIPFWIVLRLTYGRRAA